MSGKNLYLTGFMGCGKSRVGRELAKALNRKFVDTDKLIQDKAGITISEIFAKHGEAHFRTLEREVILALKDKTDLIVSLGGGAVMEEANQAVFKTGLWIFIDTPYDVLVERVARNNKRPLARDPQKMLELYNFRLPTYQKAHITVTGESQSDAVVKKILLELSCT